MDISEQTRSAIGFATTIPTLSEAVRSNKEKIVVIGALLRQVQKTLEDHLGNREKTDKWSGNRQVLELQINIRVHTQSAVGLIQLPCDKQDAESGALFISEFHIHARCHQTICDVANTERNLVQILSPEGGLRSTRRNWLEDLEQAVRNDLENDSAQLDDCHLSLLPCSSSHQVQQFGPQTETSVSSFGEIQNRSQFVSQRQSCQADDCDLRYSYLIEPKNVNMDIGECIKDEDNEENRAKLGQGCLGTVYMAKLQDSLTVVVKVINDTVCTETMVDTLTLEIYLLCRLSNLNIIGVFGGYFPCHPAERESSHETAYNVMELATNRSLAHHLGFLGQSREVVTMSIVQKIQILAGVADGLCYLHHCNVFHGNLKPENVRLDDHFVSKLSDVRLLGFLGLADQSPWYRPPKTLHTNRGSFHADIWSFGKTMLECMTNDRIRGSIAENQMLFETIEALAEQWPREYASLAKKCLSSTSEELPTVMDLSMEVLGMSRWIVLVFDDTSALNDLKRESEFSTKDRSDCSAKLSDEEIYDLYEKGENYYQGREGIPQDYERAAEYFQCAANQGVAIAQEMLGACYHQGHGVQQDNCRALEWIEQAADQGIPNAQYTVGRFYEHGWGVAVDCSKALEWYRKAASNNDPQAQLSIGRFYKTGCEVDKDYDLAVEWFEKAASQQNASAQFQLGACYEAGLGVCRNAELALQWYTRSAESGDVEGMLKAGSFHQKGKGCEVSLRRAADWFLKAAEQGSSQGQFKTGWCLQHAKGVDQNYQEAVKWYLKSAEQNNPTAQYNLGGCYLLGLGVDKDLDQSIVWYGKAADNGNASGQFGLARAYSNGWGCVQNYELAAYWYRKAADQKHTMALVYLGHCFTNGFGVPQSYEQALECYRKASTLGSAKGHMSLGNCYYQGWAVEKDPKKAVEWWMKAADKGDAGAKTAVGWSYHLGFGVNRDYETAVAWYLEAVELDDANARSILAWCLLHGKGIERDEERAIELFKKAASQNQEFALGVCHQNGWDVPQDDVKAMEYFETSAQEENADGQFYLALCYLDGRGTPRDYSEGKRLLKLSAEQGYEDAQQLLFSMCSLGAK